MYQKKKQTSSPSLQFRPRVDRIQRLPRPLLLRLDLLSERFERWLTSVMLELKQDGFRSRDVRSGLCQSLHPGIAKIKTHR